ncbi:MAG: hypothetical protein ACOX6I_06210 [Syntrophomonadaceae bacterium]
MMEAEEIKKMGKIIKENKQPKIDLEKLPNYAAANSIACPRSADEVYSLGVNLQNYLGDIYLDLSGTSHGSQKVFYSKLAVEQLIGKEEIEKLANYNLNRLLSYFYSNGGPVIEPPLAEEKAREITPFFDRIVTNALYQLDLLVNDAIKEKMEAAELEKAINKNIIELYTSLSNLIPEKEIQDAFNELITVRKAIGEY